MCLIVFDWQPEQERCLTIASNRDEFHRREALNAHYWPDQPAIFGGRDCEKNGTWLAVSTLGKFAAVTNYRQAGEKSSHLSRGKIPTDFLRYNGSTESFINALPLDQHSGFNALLFDGKRLFYCSNRREAKPYIELPAGRYGLSNHLLDSPWPKVTKAKDSLTHTLNKKLSKQQTATALLEALRDATQAQDHELPNTGIPKDWEKLLSSICIRSQDYGTRTSTLVMLERDVSRSKPPVFHFWERQHNIKTEDPTDQYFEIETMI